MLQQIIQLLRSAWRSVITLDESDQAEVKGAKESSATEDSIGIRFGL